MNNTERYLLQLKAQFEQEGNKQKTSGIFWLSPQQRYEILREIMLPIARREGSL